MTPDNSDPMAENLDRVPDYAVPILEQAGYFEEDRLHVCDAVPPLAIRTRDGREVPLSDCWAHQPAIFVFGSYT